MGDMSDGHDFGMFDATYKQRRPQMSNKFPGTILTMLYNTRSGKTARSMPLDETNIAQLQAALQKAGPGAKIALKPTSDKYRDEKAQELKKRGSKGSPAEYILEVLSEAELQEERDRLNAQNSGDDAL